MGVKDLLKASFRLRILLDSFMLKKWFFFIVLPLLVVILILLLGFSLRDALPLIILSIIAVAIAYALLHLRVSANTWALENITPEKDESVRGDPRTTRQIKEDLADLKKQGYTDEHIFEQAKKYGIGVPEMRAVLRRRKHPYLGMAYLVLFALIIVSIIIFLILVY